MSNHMKSDAKRRMVIAVAAATMVMTLGAPAFAGQKLRNASAVSAPVTVNAELPNGDNNGNHWGQVKQGRFPVFGRSWIHIEPLFPGGVLKGALIVVQTMSMTRVGLGFIGDDQVPF